MATALAEAGATIALAGRSKDSCQDAATQIANATGRTALAFAADVTKLADVEQLANDVERELGRIDILVNNAGINIRGPIQQLTEADWDAVVDTNLKARFPARGRSARIVSGWAASSAGSVLSVVPCPGAPSSRRASST